MESERKWTGLRRRQLLSTLAVFSGATAGCLSSEETVDEDAKDAVDTADIDDADEITQQPTTVDFIEVWGWDIAADALEITATEFETQSETNVTVTEFERPALKTALKERLEAGEGAPAVSMLETIDAPDTVHSPGGLADLSDRIETAGLRDAFIDGAWESIDIDGGTYALPWDIGPVVLYYRRSLYEEYGLDPAAIETWDDFLEAGRRLPEDIALLNLPPGDLNGQWRTLCRQQGMAPLTDDGKIDITGEKSRRAATLLKDLYDAGLTTRLTGFTDQWASAFENDEIASLLSASWMVGTIQAEMATTAGDWGVFKIPAFEAGGTRASNWGGSNLVIPEQVEDVRADQAWEFISWSLARKDMQVTMFEQFGLFPTLEAAYDDPVFEEELAFFGNQPIRRTFTEVAEEIPGWRFSTATPVISAAIDDAFERMLDGEYTPAEALESATQRVADETGREIV